MDGSKGRMHGEMLKMTECCMNCIYYRPLRHIISPPFHESEESCCIVFTSEPNGSVYKINRWDMCELFTPKEDKTNEV